MGIKKRISKLLRALFLWRSEKAFDLSVKKKIHYLKKQGKYKKYPKGKSPPYITKYPFFRKSDKKWLDVYFSIFGEENKGFIPIPAYNNFIEPAMNHYLLNRAIKEKNFYDKFLKNIQTPHTYIRKIHGSFFNVDYSFIDLDNTKLSNLIKNETALIIKPSVVSGSGKSICKFIKKEDGNFYNGETLLSVKYLEQYASDFVLQKAVIQHEYFRKFNPESNNTLRVLTYRSVKDESIHLLHYLLRIGSTGSFLDHDNLGGVVVAISEDGILNDFATDINGNRHHTFNNISFTGDKGVPFFNEIKSVAENIAGQIHYGRLLALDLTVDEDGRVLLIEINSKGNGISQYQYNSGSLFKEFTEEILQQAENYIPQIHFIQT